MMQGVDLARNAVLATLPTVVKSALHPRLTPVSLVAGQVLMAAGHVIEDTFFPQGGLVSLVGTGRSRPLGLEVAMIGRDGLVGGLSLLGATTPAFTSAVVRVPGPGLRIAAAELALLCSQNVALRDACLLSVQTLARQVMWNAACLTRFTMAERYARWLLTATERLGRQDLAITQDTIAKILGVRRTGLSAISWKLQQAAIISTSRGRVTIINRPALERVAGQFSS